MTITPDNATTTIAGDGTYSFAGLFPGSYTVTPTLSGYTFSPTSESLTVSNTDETGVDFTATLDTCNDVDRFLDNNDGTVTDCRTDLIWLKNASCYGRQAGDVAMSSAGGLNSDECGLTDGSVEGDWHLATKDELQGIGTDPPATWGPGRPLVTWTIPGSPFVFVQSSYYWSSTEYDTDGAWYVSLADGSTTPGDVRWDFFNSYYYVWPVRSDN